MIKIPKLIVAVLCLVFCLAMPVQAAGYTTFHVENGTGKEGEIVTVPVQFNSGQEVGGFQLEIYYDREMMEFQGLKKGNLIIENDEGVFDYNHILESSKIIVVYAVADTVKDEGVIVDLEFKLKKDCENQLPIGMKVEQLVDSTEMSNPIQGEISGVDEDFQAEVESGNIGVSAEASDNAAETSQSESDGENPDEEKTDVHLSENDGDEERTERSEKESDDAAGKGAVVFGGILILAVAGGIIGVLLKKRKNTALLLSAAIILTTGIIPAEQAHAEESGYVSMSELGANYPEAMKLPEEYLIEETVPEQPVPFSDYKLEFETQGELFMQIEQLVKDAVLSGQTSVSLEEYHINKNEYPLATLAFFSPYLGTDDMTLRVYYSANSEEYRRIEINNSMTIAETREYFQRVDRIISKIMSVAADDMTTQEKALAVHDYFCYRYEYDMRLYDGTLPDSSYSSAGLFTAGTGVCNAYSYGYLYIMTKLGIECYVTVSDAMNHAWNLVNIDGAFYHIDCTWDDPVRNRLGSMRHKYFLVSDSKMVNELEHSGWETSIVCESTEYDSAYWTEITTQIIQEDQDLYYIKDKYIYRRNGDVETVIIPLTGRWPVWGDGSLYWQGIYSGLFYKDGYLYYNTKDKINKVNLSTEEIEVVYEPDLSEGYIYGIRDQERVIEYQITKHPSEEGAVYTTAFNAGEEIPDYIRGDADGNGVADIADLRVVLRFICGKESLTELQSLAADVTDDQAVNIDDLRKLLQFVCGKVVEL